MIWPSLVNMLLSNTCTAKRSRCYQSRSFKKWFAAGALCSISTQWGNSKGMRCSLLLGEVCLLIYIVRVIDLSGAARALAVQALQFCEVPAVQTSLLTLFSPEISDNQCHVVSSTCQGVLCGPSKKQQWCRRVASFRVDEKDCCCAHPVSFLLVFSRSHLELTRKTGQREVVKSKKSSKTARSPHPAPPALHMHSPSI
jgi:hypothetical protein